jgi:hypothetical protein
MHEAVGQCTRRLEWPRGSNLQGAKMVGFARLRAAVGRVGRLTSGPGQFARPYWKSGQCFGVDFFAGLEVAVPLLAQGGAWCCVFR